MDERDIQILKKIADSKTRSPNEIHEETGIPESTIYYRLDKLREQGIILNDLYELDRKNLGFEITIIADVFATYEEEYHEKVGEKLSAIEGVGQVYFTMGETDFKVIANLTDREEVERLIGDFEAIDEVERTESTFVVSTIKDESNVLQTYSLEALLTLLQD
jgi:DNA-binding Lrp family transcriptional regulator